MSIKIEQTLHGYDHGHRLLASSVELEASERSLLDRLSDLSGHLPFGTSIPTYLTSFPCGRFYAVAQTSPDLKGTRSGTVLTHTLLVQREAIGTVEALEQITQHFRQPDSSADVSPYKTTLSTAPQTSVTWNPVLDGDEFRLLVGTLLHRSDRPLICVSSSMREDWIFRLWKLLWSEARQQFAVCTFALGTRSLGTRSFDFLIAPPSARAAFVEASRSSVLWDSARNVQPELVGIENAEWFKNLCRVGPSWRDDFLRWTDARKLPRPPLGACSKVERLRTLEVASAQRLTAARSRVDLTLALWPTISPSHPWLMEGLQQLLSLQSTAPDEPSPLRSLQDLADREVLSKSTDAVLQREFASVLRIELAHRVERSLATAPSELSKLIASLSWNTFGVAVVSGLVDHVLQHPQLFERGKLAGQLLLALQGKPRELFFLELLQATEEREKHPLLEQVLSPLSREERRSTAASALRIAVRTFDIPLLIGLWKMLETSAPEQRAIDWILRSQRFADQRTRKLEQVSLEARVDWCFRKQQEAGLRAAAVEFGPRWIQTTGLSAQEVGDRCSEIEHGLLLFARWLDALGETSAQDALRRTSRWIEVLVSEALGQDSLLAPDSVSINAALAVADPETWMRADFRKLLQNDFQPSLADKIVARAAPNIVAGCLRATSGDSFEWLRVPGMLRWFSNISMEDVQRLVWWQLWKQALPYVLNGWEHALNEGSGIGNEWKILLTISAREADAQALDVGVNTGVRCLHRAPETSVVRELEAELLLALKQKKPQSTPQWVEVCFPHVYGLLLRGEPDPFSKSRWYSPYGWDRAREWREWLVSVWLEEGWSAGGFLRCLSGNRELLNQTLEFLRYRSGASDFVRKLLDFARRDPALQFWTPALEEWDAEYHSYFKRFLPG